MEDLSQRISQILSDPQSMQMIQSMAQSLGLNPPAPEPAPLPPSPPPAPSNDFDISQLAAMLGQLGLNQQQAPPTPPPIDMNTLLQVQKAMSLFTQGNKNVDLLRSLRPLLSSARQKKVDDAIRIMQLIQMLPMLKESGLFGSLLGGENR